MCVDFPHRQHVSLGNGKLLLFLSALEGDDEKAAVVMSSMRCIGSMPPCAVSFATLAASSVSLAMEMALSNVSSSSLMRKIAFSTASLLIEHRNRVRSASSWGSLNDSRKVACCCFLTDSGCQLVNSFPWSSFQIGPEFVSFTYNENSWVELCFHVLTDLLDAEVIDRYRGTHLAGVSAEKFVYHTCLVGEKYLCRLRIGHGMCSPESYKPLPIIRPQLRTGVERCEGRYVCHWLVCCIVILCQSRDQFLVLFLQ